MEMAMTNHLVDYELFNAGLGFVGVILLITLPLAILQITLMIAALINLLKKQVPTNEKILWLILVIAVNLIGPIIYFAVGSAQLDEKAAKYEDEQREQYANGN